MATREEKRNWIHGTTQGERITYLLESGLYSDVTCIVGEQRVCIKAHKVFLMTASSEFERLFTNDPTKTEFVFANIEPEIFRLLLKFIYTGEWSKNLKDVIPLLNAAKIYNLPDLELIYLLRIGLTKETAIKIFQQAVQYNEKELEISAMKLICKNAYEVIESEQFLELGIKHLEGFLGRDDLAVKSEIQLFQALIRWSEAECRRQQINVTPKHCRSFLETLIPYIRFPQMEQGDFLLKVCHQSILTETEVASVLNYYNVPINQRSVSSVHLGLFNTYPRQYYLLCKNRILKRLHNERNFPFIDHTMYSRFWNRICFKADGPIWLRSIGLNKMYADKKKPTTFYNVDIRLDIEDAGKLTKAVAAKKQVIHVVNTIKDAGTIAVADETESVKVLNNIGAHYQVNFDKPLKIDINTWYTASLRITGDTYYEKCYYDAKKLISCNGRDGNIVNIEFKKSNLSGSTNIDGESQIATLGFLVY